MTLQDADMGWYLYGVTRQADLCDTDGAPAVTLLRCGELAAIVRKVPLADFDLAAFHAHAEDVGWINAMAHAHNKVISAIHQRQTILPARVGAVYRNAEDVRSALAEDHDVLLARLLHVEGCEEWGLHVFVGRTLIEEGALADPAVRKLAAQMEVMPRGRAYFLRKKLEEARASAEERALGHLASEVYDRLAGLAVESEIGAAGRASVREDEMMVLRAAFLVAREASGPFADEAASLSHGCGGVRVELTGPWPPYSFAAPGREAPV